MAPIEVQDCLSALLFGYHYHKPKYSIANHFNEFADELFENISNIEVRKIGGHSISFRIKDLYLDISEQNLMIYSQISISEKLTHLLQAEQKPNEKSISVPLFFGLPFIPPLVIGTGRTCSSSEFRKTFIAGIIELLKLIEKFIPNGLPKCRFMGFVENYYIPLKAVKWDILEKFNEQANIEDTVNTQKEATNTYYFPKDDGGNEKCFIFKMIRPDFHRDPNATIAGASFDFQYHPGTPQNMDELGGPDIALKPLISDLEDVINKSKFLKFSYVEKK